MTSEHSPLEHVLRDQLAAAHKREKQLLAGLVGMLSEPQVEADAVRHILTVALFGGETWREDDLDTFNAIRAMIAVHGLPEPRR